MVIISLEQKSIKADLHINAIKPNCVFLEFWDEIRGKLLKISKDDYNLYLDVDNKFLVFRKESNEGSFIIENLQENHIGKEIALLRTDIPTRPILIQFISKKD